MTSRFKFLLATLCFAQLAFPAGLQSSRSFVIPNESEQARETTAFELITWLVVKAP